MELWDTKKSSCFQISKRVDLGKASDNLTVRGEIYGGIIHIHQNGDVHGSSGPVDLTEYLHKPERNTYITAITTIKSNLIMVASAEVIVFVSLPSREIVASVLFGNGNYLYVATILRGGRIHAAGKQEHCTTFIAADIIRADLRRYANEIYNESGAAPTTSSPGAYTNDEGSERVSGFWKRERAEGAEGTDSAPVTEMKLAMKKLEEEMKKTKLELDGQKEEMLKMISKLQEKEYRMKLKRKARTALLSSGSMWLISLRSVSKMSRIVFHSASMLYEMIPK